jgi:hypothetical protein
MLDVNRASHPPASRPRSSGETSFPALQPRFLGLVLTLSLLLTGFSVGLSRTVARQQLDPVAAGMPTVDDFVAGVVTDLAGTALTATQAAALLKAESKLRDAMLGQRVSAEEGEKIFHDVLTPVQIQTVHSRGRETDPRVVEPAAALQRLHDFLCQRAARS